MCFLLEEEQGEVFLRLEIVEQSAFGDARFPRNLPGRRSLKALLAKQLQRRRKDLLFRSLFVLLPFPHPATRAVLGRGPDRLLFRVAHKMSALIFV